MSERTTAILILIVCFLLLGVFIVMIFDPLFILSPIGISIVLIAFTIFIISIITCNTPREERTTIEDLRRRLEEKQ